MIVAINKPPGYTSFDVVRKVRSMAGGEKVGHAGTLDPFAQGVLVVGIGRESTKKLSHLTLEDKEYEAILKLGVETDTLDTEGEIVKETPIPNLTDEHIEKIFGLFVGVVKQTPPMYSAKKVGGVRLYDLARRGVEVEREPVSVEIKSLTLKNHDKDTIGFEVTCSKGTYVRQLGADIARELGTVGHLIFLNRVRVGDFTLEDCVTIDKLSETWLSIAN